MGHNGRGYGPCEERAWTIPVVGGSAFRISGGQVTRQHDERNIQGRGVRISRIPKCAGFWQGQYGLLGGRGIWRVRGWRRC